MVCHQHQWCRDISIWVEYGLATNVNPLILCRCTCVRSDPARDSGRRGTTGGGASASRQRRHPSRQRRRSSQQRRHPSRQRRRSSQQPCRPSWQRRRPTEAPAAGTEANETRWRYCGEWTAGFCFGLRSHGVFVWEGVSSHLAPLTPSCPKLRTRLLSRHSSVLFPRSSV